jgi:glutaredoxin 3
MMAVILYTMTDCPFCQRAKDILKEMKVPYEERNITGNIKHHKELLRISKDDKLPTIVVNKEILVKPGEDKLRAMLNFELNQLAGSTPSHGKSSGPWQGDGPPASSPHPRRA